MYKSIFLLLFLASCITLPQQTNVKVINSKEMNQEVDTLYSRALDYISKTGLTVIKVDKKNGRIVAEGNALLMQDCRANNSNEITAKYLLADCGKINGVTHYAEKLYVIVAISPNNSGSKVTLLVNFYRKINNSKSECFSTGEFEKQIFHYIETGVLIPYPIYQNVQQN